MKTPKEFLIEWLNSYTGLNTQSIYDLAKEVDNRYNQALQLQQTGVSGQSEQLPCFLYKDERGIFIGYHGDTNVTEEWNDYLKTR